MEQVRYAGTIDESALVDEYNKAWVYCLVSSYEGFGVPAIEAMACGTTVVAVDNPGTRDVVRHEHNGLLAAAGAFADSLDRALADPALRSRLEANGLRTARESYDIHSVAERYERVYRRLGTVKK
jgi:phosphatidylinositol alpha-mannosyltransferase